MSNIINRLEDINALFDEAISYEDWDAVDEARKELLFLARDLDTDSPISQFDEDS